LKSWIAKRRAGGGINFLEGSAAQAHNNLNSYSNSEETLMNKAEIKGNVGKDPSERTMPSGNKIVSLTVATSKAWKDKETGEDRSVTDWHNVEVTNQKLAAYVMENVRKGALVEAIGSLKTDHWKKDGVDQSMTKIVVPFEDGFKLVAKAKAKEPAPV
jgi:single stranded DNA-binding protein